MRGNSRSSTKSELYSKTKRRVGFKFGQWHLHSTKGNKATKKKFVYLAKRLVFPNTFTNEFQFCTEAGFQFWFVLVPVLARHCAKVKSWDWLCLTITAAMLCCVVSELILCHILLGMDLPLLRIDSLKIPITLSQPYISPL